MEIIGKALHYGRYIFISVFLCCVLYVWCE